MAEARARLGVASSAPLILYIGNLYAVKAVDVLLDACARLATETFAFRLVVIGDGPLRSQLEARATARGIGGRVRFLGALPQTCLPDWYRAADLLVLPSHSEGVPNARLGRSRLVAPNSPDALADAIRESLASPPPFPDVGPRGRDEAVRELEQFLSECVRRDSVEPLAALKEAV